MGMLCGALEVTKGDTWVNGYSITHQRTLARRNLGIAMQQDVIWVRVSLSFLPMRVLLPPQKSLSLA